MSLVGTGKQGECREREVSNRWSTRQSRAIRPSIGSRFCCCVFCSVLFVVVVVFVLCCCCFCVLFCLFVCCFRGGGGGGREGAQHRTVVLQDSSVFRPRFVCIRQSLYLWSSGVYMNLAFIGTPLTRFLIVY